VGGIKRGSITASIPCTAASTIYRLENCDADTTFLATPSYIATGADGTAVAINNRVYFDDIITYYRQ
jgi:hypothetical protein